MSTRSIVERRGMQWALDTFTSAMKLTSQSFWGLIDIIQDVWEAAPDMPDSGEWTVGRIWWIIVLGLAIMNIWTWMSLSQSRAREDLTKKRLAAGAGYGYGGVLAPGHTDVSAGEREILANVATEAVRVFWDGVVDRQNEKWRSDLEQQLDALRKSLKELEARLPPAGPALD